MNSIRPYTFGSMSLGRNPVDIANDLVVARRAMESGGWFHSSPTYNQGFAYMVLRAAFDEDRSRVPRMVLKVRDGSVPLMRFEVEDSCRRLGLDTIDVAQLVSMDPEPGNLVDQLRNDSGPLVEELASLRERGLIRQAVLFITKKNSEAAVEAVKSPLVDGLILYWNAFQRDCTDAAWKSICSEKIPVLALRTLGGGPTDERNGEKPKILKNLMEQAGCRNASDFALNLVASENAILTTIGGTASLAHLEEYYAAEAQATPFNAEIKQQAENLQCA